MAKTERIKGSVIWVTGASSGIGEAVAHRLADLGGTVYGAARRLPAAYAAKGSGAFRPLTADITDSASVQACAARILGEAGRIDLLINCAGSGIAGALEDCSPEETLGQFDVNTVGALRTAQAVLPAMRAQGGGVILNIGSIGGDFALPYQGLYSMSKAALRKQTECLRLETARFGVQACVIEPGDLKTGFTAARRFSQATAGSVYEQRCRAAVEQMARDEQGGGSPDCVADKVVSLLGRRRLPACVAVGGVYVLFPLLGRLLPYRAVEALLARMYHA